MGEAKRRAAHEMSLPSTFCPATACPLFAREGSPWTGDHMHACPHANRQCKWWHGFLGAPGCNARHAALEQVADAELGRPVLQVGPIRAQKERIEPKVFDCPHAANCEWQTASGSSLCPPRLALSKGIDPRIVAY